MDNPGGRTVRVRGWLCRLRGAPFGGSDGQGGEKPELVFIYSSIETTSGPAAAPGAPAWLNL